MTRDQAEKALAGAYARAINTLEDVFVAGLATGEAIEVLAERYDRGFALAVEGNKAMAARVDAYFAKQGQAT